eukprot:21717-Pelagococcus_subviridis.AAC.4
MDNRASDVIALDAGDAHLNAFARADAVLVHHAFQRRENARGAAHASDLAALVEHRTDAGLVYARVAVGAAISAVGARKRRDGDGEPQLREQLRRERDAVHRARLGSARVRLRVVADRREDDVRGEDGDLLAHARPRMKREREQTHRAAVRRALGRIRVRAIGHAVLARDRRGLGEEGARGGRVRRRGRDDRERGESDVGVGAFSLKA